MTIQETIPSAVGSMLASSTRLEIKASDLHDLLAGTIIATGTDSFLPTLTGIHIYGVDGVLVAESTERYRLIKGTLTPTRCDNFSALLLNKNAAEVIRALKPLVKRIEPRPVIVEIGEKEIIFCLPEQSFTFRLLDGTFPPTEFIFNKEIAPTERISFDPALLATFSKVPSDGKRVPMIFTFHGSKQVATMSLFHETIKWELAIMPMRNN